MSTVDARDITKPVDEDFVPQTTAELRALKVLVAAIETALQNEDLDIRADVTTLLRSKLQVPILDLALPALVANGALIVNGAGTGLVWDADYGEFVANAGALTAAVEAATLAAAAAQAAAEDAQEAVDTGAVNKASTAEQIMNGDLTIQRDTARLRLQSDTTPTKMFDIEISSTKAQLSAEGGLLMEVVGDLDITGELGVANLTLAGAGVLPSGAALDLESGASLIVQPGADLVIWDDPVDYKDAANKGYVDRLRTYRYWGSGVSTATGYQSSAWVVADQTAAAITGVGSAFTGSSSTVRAVVNRTGIITFEGHFRISHSSGTVPTGSVRIRLKIGTSLVNPEFDFPLTSGSMSSREFVSISGPINSGETAQLHVQVPGADATTQMTVSIVGPTYTHHTA